MASQTRSAGLGTRAEPERLPARLAAVAAVLPADATLVVADVATGRGELALSLAASGRARRVIATDRSHKAVAIVSRLVAEACLADRIEVRHGDGLSALSPGEANVVVIAGIGGRLMRTLLRRDLPYLVIGEGKAPALVLQPQSEPGLIRDWALNEAPSLRYASPTERLVRDSGRYYHVLAVTPATEEASQGPPHEQAAAISPPLAPAVMAEVGPLLWRDPILEGYLLWRAEALANLAAEAGGSASPAGTARATAAARLAAEMRAAAAAHRAAPSGGA